MDENLPLAPFFVFVAAPPELEEPLLRELGVVLLAPPSDLDGAPLLHLAHDGRWLHIADDWRYSLWNAPWFRPRVADLGARYDLFWCMVGDSCRSYAFELHQGGQPRRRLVVDDDHGRSEPRVVEDAGPPLIEESSALLSRDELDAMLAIARSIGVDTRHDELEIRARRWRQLPNLH